MSCWLSHRPTYHAERGKEKESGQLRENCFGHTVLVKKCPTLESKRTQEKKWSGHHKVKSNIECTATVSYVLNRRRLGHENCS